MLRQQARCDGQPRQVALQNSLRTLCSSLAKIPDHVSNVRVGDTVIVATSTQYSHAEGHISQIFSNSIRIRFKLNWKQKVEDDKTTSNLQTSQGSSPF